MLKFSQCLGKKCTLQSLKEKKLATLFIYLVRVNISMYCSYIACCVLDLTCNNQLQLEAIRQSLNSNWEGLSPIDRHARLISHEFFEYIIGSAIYYAGPVDPHECLFSAALVSETTSPDGLLIQVISSAKEGVSQFNKTLRGLSLPAECTGERFQKCNILEIFNQFLIVPADGNLVSVDLFSREATPILYELSCNPINIFFDDAKEYMWVVCVSGSFLTQIALAASVSTEGTLTLQMDATLSHNTPVQYSASFSETILVSNSSCSSEQLYTVVDGQAVWHFPISSLTFDHFDEQLQHCDGVLYIEHSDRDESFTVHCSNGVSTEVSTCMQKLSPANVKNSTRFSCSERFLYYQHNSLTVTFSNDGTATTMNHTIGPIQRGFCKNHYFLAITEDSSLWAVHLDTGTITLLAWSVCEGGRNVSCLVPSFGSENGFLVYDTAEGSLKSVHILPDCGTPIVETYPGLAIMEPSLLLARESTHKCDRECWDVGDMIIGDLDPADDTTYTNIELGPGTHTVAYGYDDIPTLKQAPRGPTLLSLVNQMAKLCLLVWVVLLWVGRALPDRAWWLMKIALVLASIALLCVPIYLIGSWSHATTTSPPSVSG